MDLIKKKFKKRFGIEFDEFMLLDRPNEIAVPENEAHPVCPGKYMLYSDPFLGFLDSTVRLGEGKKYVEYAKELRAAGKKTKTYGYLFDTIARLCDVLADKYELGVITRAAYKAGDKEELMRLAKEEYSRLEVNMRGFMKAFEKQWLKENKPYGLEIHHHRLGGMLNRIGYCKKCLLDYACGKTDSIPELEEDILTFKKNNESIYFNNYHKTYTSALIQ